jgi:SAM-dependent methyltransferase
MSSVTDSPAEVDLAPPSPQPQIDNTSIARRVVQSVCDIAHRPMAGLRILDLGCAHGEYSIEFASRGAQVLGIEGREAWLEQARRKKRETGLANVEFVQDDVRNLSKEKYGEFDIVLCLGVLYHLDAPDVFDFLNSVSEVCRDFAIIETHFARTPADSREWRGEQYWGASFVEHAPDTAPADKLKELGASLENERSFWLTQSSLCNILRHVGFTSVHDSRNPIAHLYIGEQKELKIWGDRVTFAAIKGEPVSLFVHPEATAEREIDWPEDLGRYLMHIDLKDGANEANESQSGTLRRLIKKIVDKL